LELIGLLNSPDPLTNRACTHVALDGLFKPACASVGKGTYSEKIKTGMIHVNGQLINVEENVPFGGELLLLW